MKHRILFLLKYYLFWLIVFWLCKAIFLLYNFPVYSKYSFSEIFKIFLYGTKLDLSFAAYVTVIPLFIVAFSSFFKSLWFEKTIFFYSCLLIPFLALITFSDIEIFKWWGFRIDSTLFKYSNTPKEVVASIWMSPIFILSFAAIAFSYLLIKGYKKYIGIKHLQYGGIPSFLIIALLTPVLFVIIRGGFQLSPINQSAVYFSNDQFLNQAAVNAPWNLSYSIIEKHHNEENPFVSQSENEAMKKVSALYNDSSEVIQVVKKGNINVILIIWESFTAKTVEATGGIKGITPNINKLIHEGVFFKNIYASGDRSDKGLIAVLSGFPAQPITSIMNKTTKAAKLPALSKTFSKHNYSTSFYYGGEPEFANIKSYLLSSNYSKIVSKENFPPESWNSKWGAHDEVVLERLHQDINKSAQPFFATIFTLSSHEPFEIPAPPLLPEKDNQSLFLNSIHYTDSCIGSFIDKARKEAWWDNTLIIITADHGHPLPTSNGVHAVTHLPSEFHIPMLWLGGALSKKDTIISTIGSQTDISNTLLYQLQLPTKDFKFSKNLLSKTSYPFAYYAFNNGFGFVTLKGDLVRDNISKTFLEKSQDINKEDEETAKAYLQYSFQEYLNK